MDLAELVERPLYSPAEAARLVRLDPSRVRRWLRGYEYEAGPPSSRVRRRKPPLLAGRGAAERQEASFLDLIELLTVKHLVERRISLQKLRRVATDLRQRHRISHPFATQRFYVLGSTLFVEMRKQLGAAFVETPSGGQRGIPEVIVQCGQQIDFDRETELATCWWPLGRDRQVVVTPQRAFGAPCVAGRGIKTASVYDLYLGEQRNGARVSRWFDLSAAEVRDAVEIEERIAAA